MSKFTLVGLLMTTLVMAGCNNNPVDVHAPGVDVKVNQGEVTVKAPGVDIQVGKGVDVEVGK